jgi:hypothetical protein
LFWNRQSLNVITTNEGRAIMRAAQLFSRPRSFANRQSSTFNFQPAKPSNRWHLFLKKWICSSNN